MPLVRFFGGRYSRRAFLARDTETEKRTERVRMPTSADTVMRTWFEQLSNQGQESTIDRLLAVDARIHGLPTPDGQPIRGPEAFKQFYRTFRIAFPDIHVDVERTLVDGDMVAAHCHVTGRHLGDMAGARLREIRGVLGHGHWEDREWPDCR